MTYSNSEVSKPQLPFLYIGDSMFKLIQMKDQLLEAVGGASMNVSLIAKQDVLILKLYRRAVIPYSTLVDVDIVLGAYELKIGAVKAVSDGVLSYEVGLEISIVRGSETS